MTETLTPGTVFAGYLIERVLGIGGMGTVYVARHPRLPRRDALKVLAQTHSGDEEFRARFIREAELAARLEHPNIVAVHDRGVHDGQLWIAMQFVDGIDAAGLIRHDAADLPPERVSHIVGSAARGLDAAHRAGLLHRDVKPANILLESRPGEPDRVFVSDFGIARAAGQSTALTAVGSVLATLAYAAPEQLMGGVVDRRADVYALGCTLYELLTRTKPFPRDTAVAVMQAHIQDPPPRATTANPLLPQAIDRVIARSLAKNPDDRYPSCGALADAAAVALDGRVDALTIDLGNTVPRRPARRRVGLAIGIAASVVVVGVASAVVLTRNSAEPSVTPSTIASTTSTAATSPPAVTGTTTSGRLSWGSHTFIAQAFPELLPATPVESGYQGLRCVARDLNNRPVDVNQPAPAVADLDCNGNRDPVESVLVGCNSNRSPTNYFAHPDFVPIGDERWERRSGRGRILWFDTTTADNDPLGPNRPQGLLRILFDDPQRNFCSLFVSGGNSGRDLYDRWWRSAPF
ncbi:serine/threonine-protein kinase [Nocardia pseudovaccinii]|uniref:serine/threonine-protein kinase n=1 Tax=Nocardia pseudovaccinii TaxID=189540 RepID=UPI0007A4C31C|nr:serine/threonine-protein kinase [Nocardia pseudovaccinii]